MEMIDVDAFISGIKDQIRKAELELERCHPAEYEHWASKAETLKNALVLLDECRTYPEVETE